MIIYRGFMSKISYIGVKELVIHGLYNVSVDDFLKIASIVRGNKPVYWCDGIVFFYGAPIPPHGEPAEALFTKGIEHWFDIYYAEVGGPYRNMLELEDSDFRGVKLLFINADEFEPHKSFVTWLKSKK